MRQLASSFPTKAASRAIFRGDISSNLQHTLASKVVVSSHRKGPVLAAFFALLSVAPRVSATPNGSWINTPAPTVRYVPAQLSGRAPRTIAAGPGRTFDRLGPQATERAVRSSLKAALVPDPVAMGALIFCAFTLRWMRLRNQQRVAAVRSVADAMPALPRAA
jgi:hypothetical protein